MSVRLGLLGLLKERPSHGYDLKLRYDELMTPGRPVQPAQVYSTLGRLERDGRVGVVDVGQDAGPQKRIYALTPDGVAEIDQWLAEPIQPEPHLQAELYSKVVIAVLDGRSVAGLLDVQRAAHLARMRELTHARQSSDVATSTLAEYALFHLEADLRWLDVTAAREADVARRVRQARGEHR